ncbi:hypothetical protein [Saliniradius amylolyticus]|uniref:hypothetical protein n=1 Tax=Saliniradius amylolyticus TaxID=2183582 RepID=UPI000D69C251|nr:hypothetical protein [Saliniradius amylolyticus]
MTDTVHHIDLTEWRCPQSLLELKRALRNITDEHCRVRMKVDSAADAKHWLTLRGCQWQGHRINEHDIELSFYWDSHHA